MSLKLSMAPLQGYTDWVFRKAYQKYFGGVDEFYTPYIVLQNDGAIKSAHRREVELEAGDRSNIIPQILCGNPHEFVVLTDYLKGLGYCKVNWNLGCPYPMVTRKGRGSGLLPQPQVIREILQQVMDNVDVSVSVKIRLGYDDDSQIFPVLDVLNEFAIDEIIVHPRIGKQLYKGSVDLKRFEQCLSLSKHPLAYNGDIANVSDLRVLQERFPDVSHWMIGRGVLKNLWFPCEIKGIEKPSDMMSVLRSFHDYYLSLYSGYLSGESQVLMKVKPLWEYFSFHFSNPHKVYKGIKKAKNMDKYYLAVESAFRAG